MARTTNVQSARRLLNAARPAESAQLPDDHATGAAPLLQMLFRTLGPVIGQAGVRATFARSVKLTHTTHPYACLDSLLTARDAHDARHEPQQDEVELPARLMRCLAELDRAAANATALDLYATFFELMSNLIGDELLWQIVKRPAPGQDESGIEETD